MTTSAASTGREADDLTVAIQAGTVYVLISFPDEEARDAARISTVTVTAAPPDDFDEDMEILAVLAPGQDTVLVAD